MLEFLVTSKARRRLLQLLWSQGEQGSASQFAKLARVGFASSYRELRAMQALGLAVSERKEGAEVYRANLSHPLADALRELVVAPARPAEDSDRHLRGQLKALGAPLQESEENPVGLLEEVVVRGVNLAHRDPDVARTLPVCLYRQRHTLQATQLHHFALQLGEKRSLGFFLELTAVLSGDDRFANWTSTLRDRRCKASLDFFHTASRSRLQREVADLKTSAVARNWGLRMNMDMEAFRSTFDKFVNVA
jgi:hypothetical protein